MMRARLTALPGPCRNALLDVAVRGRVDLDTVPEPVRLDPAFVDGVLHRVGSEVEFAHPLLRSAVVDSASPGELRAAHLAAASAAPDALTRALHLASTDLRDDESAAAELEQAGRVAFRIGDTAAAQVLGRAAVKATPGGLLTWSRLEALARALGVEERIPAPLVDELLALAASPDEEAGTWVLLAETGAYERDGWVAMARRAMAVEGITPGMVLRAANTLVAAMLFAGRPCPEQLEVLDTAIARAQQQWAEEGTHLDELLSSDAFGLADCLSSRALFTRMAGQREAVEDLVLARRLGRGRDLPPEFEDATSVLGILAMWDDRHEEARTYLDLSERGEGGLRATSGVHSAELTCRLGDFDVVERVHRPSLESELPREPYAAFVLALSAAWQGDEPLCRAAIRDGKAYEDELGGRLFVVALDTAEALLELGLGRFVDARDRAQAAADVLEGRCWHEPSWIPALSVAIEASAITGSRCDAERLLARLDQHALTLESRWARAAAQRGRALLLGADGQASAGLALAIRSAELFGDIGLPAEAGRSALAAGKLARRAGERRHARDWLQRAIDLLEPRGCRGFASQAHEEMGSLGVRRAEPGDLTDAERRVAALAAAGRTNPEIAAEVYLSAKTVEAHLSRVYRKLGVRSRAELASRWAAKEFGRIQSP